MKLKLSVWGVRGSLPRPDRRFLEYGGNTSCMVLDYGDGMVCFDAGSGLAARTDALSRVRRLDILISHVHIDHILGLFSLGEICKPEIHLYGAAGPKGPFAGQLKTVIGPPYWPVGLESHAGTIHLHEITPGEAFQLPEAGGLRVRTLAGNHPGGSLLYRVEQDWGGIVYALDCEWNEALAPRLTEFARDASLLIWDANFTRADKRPGWGHSTWEEGLALGRAAGAERVLMTHYARDYTDLFLQEQEALARQENSACMFAREGMVIEL